MLEIGILGELEGYSRTEQWKRQRLLTYRENTKELRIREAARRNGGILRPEGEWFDGYGLPREGAHADADAP